jgi:hypothetical protein
LIQNSPLVKLNTVKTIILMEVSIT